jgi:hypothetical protein
MTHTVDPRTSRHISLAHLDDIENAEGIIVTNLEGERLGHITQLDWTSNVGDGYTTVNIQLVVPTNEMRRSQRLPLNPTPKVAAIKPEPEPSPPQSVSSLQRRELPQ